MILEDVFKRNRDYIGSTTLDVNKISNQFTKTKTRDWIEIGIIDVPTGRICVGDPLAYMGSGRFTPEIDQKIDPGKYPVQISLIQSAFDTIRICSCRLKIKDTESVRYELAHSTYDTAAFHSSDGNYAAFPVDAGMMAFMDHEVMQEYGKWLVKWYEDDTHKNHYDDYFSDLFIDSYHNLPEYQREGGDFIEWEIPDTNHIVVMNATGFGDGFYSTFLGYDSSGNICEILVPLIDADDIDDANEEYLNIWDGPEACIITKHIADGGMINYAIREEPGGAIPSDSGWIFYGLNEDDEYWKNPENYTIASIHSLCERFPNLIPILHSPYGKAYYATEDDHYLLDE